MKETIKKSRKTWSFPVNFTRIDWERKTKRNTVKRNVDARYGELKAELKELQSKNAKGELTSDEVTRYYLIPELLKEFDNVRK